MCIECIHSNEASSSMLQYDILILKIFNNFQRIGWKKNIADFLEWTVCVNWQYPWCNDRSDIDAMEQ